jgi:quinoprotein glucose dehydrogenase
VERSFVTSPIGVPCSPPPWGRLSAVDLSTGEIRWQQPFGSLRDLGLPFDFGTGLPSFGGPLLTRSGLVFIAAALGNGFRAYDLASGDELWHTRLPAGGQATPMTYRVDDGAKGARQFVVIAAGGHWGFHQTAGQPLGDTLVAFSLPAE